MGKVNSHFTGMGKKKHSKVMDFMNILDEAEINTNSKATRRLNCHVTGKILKKNNIFPCYALLKMSWLKQESTKSPNKGIY